MKRTQSLAAAVTVAFIGAGVASSSAAGAPPEPPPEWWREQLPPPADVPAKLRALGLNSRQILEVTSFLDLDRAAQSTILRARGIDDPGGELNDSFVADYILGQYLVKEGGNPAQGKIRQLASGKLDARAAVTLGQTLRAGDIPVTEIEIDQQAKLGFTREQATVRARLQRTATLLRPYLAKLVPSLAAVWIDDANGSKLVISTAGPVGEVVKALGGARFAGLPIEIRSTKLSRTSLGAAVADLQKALAEEADGAKVTIAPNPTTSVIRIIPDGDESAKKVKGSKAVNERVKAGDAVVEKPRKQGPSAIVGGHRTWYGGCTWGFTALAGSVKSLVTAGHCVGESQFGPWVATKFEEERWQGAVDTARHSTDSVYNNLYDNVIMRTGLPDVEITSRTRWDQVDYYDVVCHQGDTSGTSCGYVTALFTAPGWVPDATQFVLVEAPSINEQAGDSGGPWFYGNSAYGIHSGGCQCYGTFDLWGWGVYGAIDFAERDVHFLVMTK
jgi:hypothetical protein